MLRSMTGKKPGKKDWDPFSRERSVASPELHLCSACPP